MDIESELPRVIYQDGGLRLVETREARLTRQTVVVETLYGHDALGAEIWKKRTGGHSWEPPTLTLEEVLRILRNVGAYHPTVPAK